ncbi:MAG: UDP-N-acetylglucosamine 2-epimerase, partial [Candidatus Giovannonibacteria bacterium]|nr:UDP-N-acetylglucosamine 2-epimerase [Candidatus Giovannonibacteria bacterium]
MEKNNVKKIVFLTGTRADFGKIRSLISKLNEDGHFATHIFATGMHMDSKYGSTVNEIEKFGFPNIYKFINYAGPSTLDAIFANTVSGFGNFVRETKPDMIVVHGDRSEALAGALVGSMNNILVAHIEGGELSGTIDEMIRHAVSKVSHLHFVANEEAKKRLIQMGEKEDTIFVIGSPDLDIMRSENLPTLSEMKKTFDVPFDKYGIFIFHPFSAEMGGLLKSVEIVVDALIESKFNYVAVYPNNDPGTDIILDIYKKKLFNSKRFIIHPSMRFEHFLTLLKNANFIIGNSSAGIREAPFYGVPAINIGGRQSNRVREGKIGSI